jgi:hypothetical protein
MSCISRISKANVVSGWWLVAGGWWLVAGLAGHRRLPHGKSMVAKAGFTFQSSPEAREPYHQPLVTSR